MHTWVFYRGCQIRVYMYAEYDCIYGDSPAKTSVQYDCIFGDSPVKTSVCTPFKWGWRKLYMNIVYTVVFFAGNHFVYIRFLPTLFIYIYRDGSYGLLRRLIRINTPLIRHTRIIRKRIFAILGGTLGLHQPPPNHHRIVPPASRTL